MKLKLIAMAVAGLTAAGSANAVFNNITNDFDGQSELFAFAVDGVGNIQAFFDLGVNITDFTAASKSTPGTNINWNFTTGQTSGLGSVTGSWSQAWTTFRLGSTDANTKWMVGAGEFDGYYGAITTSNDSPALIAAQLDDLVQNMAATYPTLAANALNSGGTHATAANGANTAVASSNPAGVIGSSFMPSWNGNFIGNSWASINTPQAAYQFTVLFNGGATQVDAFAGKFNLGSDGVLSYAVPVPEPETYALMLAGLGMVGLIARRRRVV